MCKCCKVFIGVVPSQERYMRLCAFVYYSLFAFIFGIFLHFGVFHKILTRWCDGRWFNGGGEG